MTVDIMTIGDHVIEYPEATSKEFLTVEEYLKIARRMIRSIAPYFRVGLAEQILSSQDAVSNIATQIMMADWRWDGRGTLYGYRKQCAEWAIKGFIDRDVARSKHRVLSLNTKIKGGEDMSAEYADMVPSHEKEAFEVVEVNERTIMQTDLIESVLNSGVLTDTQEQCIRLYFLEEQTLSDIGKSLGVSRQAIQDNVKRGISKLQSIANVKVKKK